MKQLNDAEIKASSKCIFRLLHKVPIFYPSFPKVGTLNTRDWDKILESLYIATIQDQTIHPKMIATYTLVKMAVSSLQYNLENKADQQPITITMHYTCIDKMIMNEENKLEKISYISITKKPDHYDNKIPKGFLEKNEACF